MTEIDKVWDEMFKADWGKAKSIFVDFVRGLSVPSRKWHECPHCYRYFQQDEKGVDSK